jgi:two-component system CAI-1 autoinducer sensor kinase/phosphatase CqsS
MLYGCLAWLSPLAAFNDYAIGNPTYDTFPIRLSAAILAIPLILSQKLKHLRFFPYYFVFIITYGFPFSFGYMMITNSLSAPNGTEIHMIWIFQYFVALFLFIQLVNHGGLTIILWAFASAASIIPIFWIPHPNLVELERVVLFPVFGYLTALIFGILTNRNIDIVNTEKVRTAAAIGSNIAHELRTPLASVRSLAHGLKNYLPSLIDGYEKAKANDLSVDPIRPYQLEQIELALSTIEDEVAYSNTVIDMLLINTADKPFADLENELFDASSAIELSVSRYPFNNSGERSLIHVEIDADFRIRAPQLMVVHVLFNLIKNGLYYVQSAGKGEVTISTRMTNGNNQILVIDTGSGIPPIVQKQIFERFYTTTKTGQGAGIGLSFCNMVMESIGGSISCESMEGEYTRFTLNFPVPR